MYYWQLTKSTSKSSVFSIVLYIYNIVTGTDGRIVFGVRPEGRVHGVSVNREERDQFRLGVDRMMVDHLTPVVIHSMYEVVYCPVVRSQGHPDPRTRKLLKDVFVVGEFWYIIYASLSWSSGGSIFMKCLVLCHRKFQRWKNVYFSVLLEFHLSEVLTLQVKERLKCLVVWRVDIS